MTKTEFQRILTRDPRRANDTSATDHQVSVLCTLPLFFPVGFFKARFQIKDEVQKEMLMLFFLECLIRLAGKKELVYNFVLLILLIALCCNLSRCFVTSAGLFSFFPTDMLLPRISL